jgi:nickel transport system permease protein
MILHIAGLSFLGLGIQPPTPEWGAMLNDGREYFRRIPALMVYPGLMIFMVSLSFNFVGDALRDVLDPRTEQRINVETLTSELQNG